jgi:hypothetical protein
LIAEENNTDGLFTFKKVKHMARTDSNALLKGFSGAIGKQIVVKQYGDKTVISKYPDMSGVKASPNQKKRRSVFYDG